MAAEKSFENRIKSELHGRGAWRVKFFANAFTPSGWERFLQLLDDIQAGWAIDINDSNYIMK